MRPIDVDQDRRHVDSFYLDCHHDERDGADESQTETDRMHHAIGDDLSAVVMPADLARTFAWKVHELRNSIIFFTLMPSYTAT